MICTELPNQSLSSPNYCNVRFGNILANTPPIQPAPDLVLPRVYESPLRAQLPNPNPQLSESQSASALLSASVSPAGPSTSVDHVCTPSLVQRLLPCSPFQRLLSLHLYSSKTGSLCHLSLPRLHSNNSSPLLMLLLPSRNELIPWWLAFVTAFSTQKSHLWHYSVSSFSCSFTIYWFWWIYLFLLGRQASGKAPCLATHEEINALLPN